MKAKQDMSKLTSEQRKRFAGAIERVGDDEEILIVLAEMASEDAPVLMAKLEGEISKGFLDAAAQTAHALKGLLSTFETGEPVEGLQSLIDSAREEDEKETTLLFESLKPKLLTLVEQVAQLS
ncbi:hypothetical protein [Aporhodopirellula aestuarii]|uniref:HPt domain-containing protein n=1 Tax=Aporhodopirellula aestuarii TaxID=2950107 RepID=A0ABT0U5N3_9BACT|nr:hypothetical protein [Aporhodopirellula aestuarii]MCM2371651.1 hypothetical protein [Aporhodopirellula aestuarii]